KEPSPSVRSDVADSSSSPLLRRTYSPLPHTSSTSNLLDEEDDIDFIRETPPPLSTTAATGVVNPTNITDDGSPPSRLLSLYSIEERVELGRMTSLFFSVWGRFLFYLCLVVYLYGDLAIYGTAVAKSLRDVVPTFLQTIPVTSPSTRMISAGKAFRKSTDEMPIACFCQSCLVLAAFGTMITLACLEIGKHGPQKPPVAQLPALPALFGACVYSFMCHHSLPSLVTPIRDKLRLRVLIFADYVLILCFYALLAFTGIFAFDPLYDLYTLNFQPNRCDPESAPVKFVPLQLFLALFPVFTLSTNFPIISITLSNNLKALFLRETRRYGFFVDRILFALLALIPPVAVSFATESLELLVAITGSFAGVGIQYFVPALLVFCARRRVNLHFPGGATSSPGNPFASPFRHTAWVVFVILWALACVGFVSVNLLTNR
ncbi:unnamed protein product, partial [Cyprideis torosa]